MSISLAERSIANFTDLTNLSSILTFGLRRWMMQKAKLRSGERSAASARRRRDAPATMTTALVVDAGALPKGVAGFMFKAPSSAVKALAGKPAKVKPLLQ